MNGIKAVVCGMIFVIAAELILKEIFKAGIDTKFVFDYKALIIIAILTTLKLVYKKKMNPIIMIIISAVLGIIGYGLLGNI
jgi:glucose uptake protein GlcU